MTSDTKQLLLESLHRIPSVVFNLLWAAKDLPPCTKLATMRNLVLSLPQSEMEHFREECEFIRNVSLEHLEDIKFPYCKRKFSCINDGCKQNETGRCHGLPYVVHKKKHKVFFPKRMSEMEALADYQYFTQIEGILGGGALVKSPHNYQDSEFCIEDGEVLLDVGCAEALFTIDNIDRIKKAYLLECGCQWKKPLLHTFEQYQQKIKLIDKMVSDVTTKRSIRLVDALSDCETQQEHFFVKMDIEGYERHVIQGNEDFFRNNKIKLSCCTYHRQDDGIVIENLLKSFGYSTRYSQGYILTDMNGIHFPYFRHGVIYARNY